MISAAKKSRNCRGLIRYCGRWGAYCVLTMLFLCPFPMRGLGDDTNDFDQVDSLKKLSLEELMSVQVDTVTGASKHTQKISDAPADVTILTAEDFKIYGWRTLGEALRSVSGLLVTYDRDYEYLGVRGFDQPGDLSGRVLVTIDGHRMNDPIFDSTAIDTDFPLDIDMIERIEVIRGPSSILYGNNALFGVINVITRSAQDINGAEVSGSYGSFDTYTARATVAHSFTNGVKLVLSGSWNSSDGNSSLYYPEFSSVNGGVARNMDEAWARNAFGSLTWGDFSLEGGYSDRFKQVPTAQFNEPGADIVFNDPTFRTIDARAWGDLRYHHTFGDDWEFTARTYYDHYRYEGWYPYQYEDDQAGVTTINYDLEQSESAGEEIQLGKTIFEQHHLIIGTETRYDYHMKLLNEDLDPKTTYFDANEAGYFTGGYIQDEYQVLNNLLINAGLRWDYFHEAGNAISPRAAVIWHPWEPSTFKFLYGQAYRAPNAWEYYYGTATNPPALRPETVHSYELEYDHQFNRVWSARASLFYNQLDNTITDGGDVGMVNLESAKAYGAETEVLAHWANGLQGRVSYTYEDARDNASGEPLVNSPEYMFKLNLAAPVWRQNIFASTELQWIGGRHTVPGGSVPAYCVVNVGLFSRELVRGVEISADVYNLFDQHYSDPVSADFVQSAIEQNGRTFRVKLTWRF